MMSSHVDIQMALLFSLIRTELTLIRSLPSVLPHVDFQVVTSAERFAANVTMERLRFEGFLSCETVI